MCQACRDFDKKKYPDLGTEAHLEVSKVDNFGMDATNQFLRIYQEREVEYMGIEGVEVRKEYDCVYIPWHMMIQTMDDMIELYEKRVELERRRHNDQN